MSEPDIYTIKLTGYPEDHYVLWRDYERLKDYHKEYIVGLVERLTDCKAEADRLKAEVERLETFGADATLDNRILEVDYARLKAEVERLTDENVTLRMERMQDETGKRITYADYARLKAEVERLKALVESNLNSSKVAMGKADTVLHERDSLKAEVESLKKPAIIGGYNLSEYIRMANSETLEFDNGDIFADMTLPERIKYIVESHARLKAEVERLRKVVKIADGAVDCVIQVHDYGFEKIDTEYVSWLKRSYYTAKEGKPSV